jgi:hypothetical protein
MVLLSGSTTGKSQAIGVDLKGDIAMAGMTTKSRTNLAASLDPGFKPSNNEGIGFLGCGGLLAFSALVSLFAPNGTEGAVIGLVIGGIFLAIGMFKRSDGATKLPGKIAEWEPRNTLKERGWVCHRCGHTWNPS